MDPARLVEMLVHLQDDLTRLSRWVDEANKDRDPETQTWGRIAKLTEECGEVVEAYIGVTGLNPRKGVTHDMADVERELLDVAVTALAAYEHVTGNQGRAVVDLCNFTCIRWERASAVDR